MTKAKLIEIERRARVVALARRILPRFVALDGEGSMDAEAYKAAILIAEGFETVAAKYMADGKSP